MSAASHERRPDEQPDDQFDGQLNDQFDEELDEELDEEFDGEDRAHVRALLTAMRAFHAGDSAARAPLTSAAPAGGSALGAELCALFNAIADRAQALELEVSRLRRGDDDDEGAAADAGTADENVSVRRLGKNATATTDLTNPAEPTDTPAAPDTSDTSDTAAPTDPADLADPSDPADPADAEKAPAILVLEADPATGEPMRDAARTALRGLGGVWDQASVLRVGSPEAVREAVADHRVVSALLDASAPSSTLRSVLGALDALVPGVPLLCFAPDGDPTAYDQAEDLTQGRNQAVTVRSSAQAVERLTLHWLTQAPVAPDPLAEPAESGYGQIRFEGEKVLVVDDDVRNVFAMVSALELYGLTALTADNGPEGIELLLRNPDISAVLMDLMTPGLDGYATTARIRSYPEFADLPIIAVTARAAPGDRERSLAAGTNEHVTKPVEVDQLLILLKRLITR